MRKTLCLFILTLLLFSCGRDGGGLKDDRYYLAKLDTFLNNKGKYRKMMDLKLAGLKQKATKGESLDERYFYNKLIYENYSSFVYDSAFRYIDKNMEIAQKSGNVNWISEGHLAKAKIYSAIGLLDEAWKELEVVKHRQMSREIRLEYYMQQLHYWTQRSIYHNIPMSGEVHAYADSIMHLETSVTSPYYLWGRFWYETEEPQKEEVRQSLMQKLAVMDEEDVWYGPLCFAAGILSEVLDKQSDALKYYVKGLCIDISHVNRDLPALSIVASIAGSMGELVYANRFIKSHLAMKEDYPDRVRSSFITRPMNFIYDSTIDRLEEDAEQTRLFILFLTLLVLFLLGSISYIYVMYKKQHKLREELADINRELDQSLHLLAEQKEEVDRAHAELSEANRRLTDSNENLQDANYLKEEYIGSLFSVCSDYLGKMSDLKKLISRKLKARQYEDLLKMTSGDTQIEAEQKELNKQFDAIFLSIFPDFVEDFNALLRPDGRVTPPTGEKLNTDLRIYALVRLGIGNSTKISKILGVSPQTIYNARVKMRGRATESPLPFAERVRNLGGKKESQTHVDVHF